jgi:hypothetical protein
MLGISGIKNIFFSFFKKKEYNKMF